MLETADCSTETDRHYPDEEAGVAGEQDEHRHVVREQLQPHVRRRIRAVH